MTSHPHFRRVVLDPAPDHLRGALRRAGLPTAAELAVVKRRKIAHAAVTLTVLPQASAFSEDPPLQNTENVVVEMKAQGIAHELEWRVAESRRPRLGSGGRPSGGGSIVLLYLSFVDSGYSDLQPFLANVSNSLLAACGFDSRPSHSAIADRFADLENDFEAFIDVKNLLLRAAIAIEPRIMDVLWVDLTGWTSRARLAHACQHRCSRDRGHTQRTATDVLQARWDEVDDPHWGETDYPASSRTRLPFVEQVSGEGRIRTYGCYLIRGHFYRSLDYTSGVRSYGIGSDWFGGGMVGAVSPFVQERVAEVHAPADVNEFDLTPALFDRLCNGVGVLPKIISSDRGSFIRPLAEFWTRRGVSLLTPEKVILGKPQHSNWRQARLDEDGAPRCGGCDGPGNQSAPGDGLDLRSNPPAIVFHCMLPITPQCYGPQRVRCDHEWLKLRPLSALTELHHAIAEQHPTQESAFRRARQRSHTAENDLAGRLGRPGLPAQQLRSAAGLLLSWLRLSLRNGWLTPLTFDVRQNPNRPVTLSGSQDRRTLETRTPGTGSLRLHQLRLDRRAAGLDRPYGPAWERFLRQLRDGD